MPGFFEAIKTIPAPAKKKHMVTIAGKTIEVSLQKKLEILQHGENAYHWINKDEFALKPKPKPSISYPELVTAEKGYKFLDGDIHWPCGVVKGGYKWQKLE